MSKTHHNFGRGIALAVISLVLLTCTVEVRAAAQTPASLSKKELKTLLATARTSADQQRLAAYYRDKAQHLRAEARNSLHRQIISQRSPRLLSRSRAFPATAHVTTAISLRPTLRRPRMRRRWPQNTTNSRRRTNRQRHCSKVCRGGARSGGSLNRYDALANTWREQAIQAMSILGI